jgi:hypothetical protein
VAGVLSREAVSSGKEAAAAAAAVVVVAFNITYILGIRSV